MESPVTLPRLCCCFSFSFGLKNVKLTFATGGAGAACCRVSQERRETLVLLLLIYLFAAERVTERAGPLQKSLNTDAAAAASGLLR